jgi:hypothetical protein
MHPGVSTAAIGGKGPAAAAKRALSDNGRLEVVSKGDPRRTA